MAGCSQGEDWGKEGDTPRRPTKDGSAAVCHGSLPSVQCIYMYMYMHIHGCLVDLASFPALLPSFLRT